MVLGVNSGEVCGDPQSPNYSEPKIEKKHFVYPPLSSLLNTTYTNLMMNSKETSSSY